ncbi:MAG: hypothetical protein A2315_12690 [Ignavibacteria bacterium RIFOXYB2_FULL_35_12]|nr:MAG: hypothetical protein A2058_08845 [Ignavibacteria bacterium GWA2_36_19]OGU57408.1 MAG: hypothetical protein A2X60_16615 [Ignavibacteria bacterium GWF2_35_20]OGU88345.1 MAG: hypothetical protein A2492_08650 [Ignavibacteria bacterium RIFOXYC12_FULL_35_11]OGU91584.1 MAG: hypothetical protein A3K31_02720 [Ignavibacteria bacterium RIFOXYA12_FULL_35_25]OGU97872.1 MAG: hypothetical protein A2347_16555 [Ignavibacteria bacterium RIFOXYB12_FULL_35_14]OGU98576.1 MAG: hypothetical protein A2455_147
MQFLKITFLLLLMVCLSFGQNYKKVKIYLDEQKNVNYLIGAGIALDHFEVEKDKSLITFLSDEEFSILSTLGIRNEVLIDNWYEYYKNLQILSTAQISDLTENSKSEFGVSGFHLGSMGGYMTLAETYAELDSLKQLFPNLITTKILLGNSIENRPVYMVKISDNPDADENEPEVLYTALHHAREPMSMMQMFYFMYYLLENYNFNPTVQYLVNNRAMYFIPVVNPDGYEYNRLTYPSGGGMWRKNRRNNGGSFGVDLNRNYGPSNYWNAPNGGSSTNSGSDTYRGTAPFSEPETQIIRNFLAYRKIKNALNYHTYSNLLIYPYGALSYETPDSSIFREYAGDMTRYNGYTYGTDIQTVGYTTRGNSDDFFYDGDTLANGGKIFAMTPEVGNSSDGFWPPQIRIFPLAQENLHPNLYYAWVAGEYASVDNPNFAQSYFNPGDVVQFHPDIRNKGLSTGYNIQVELTSLSSYAIINSGIINIDSILSRNNANSINPLSFTISFSTPVETKIDLVFTTSTFGTEISKDTVGIIVGYPEFVFSDTSDNPLTLWTISAIPATPTWEATTSTFYSSPLCYTDSRTGNYANNATVTMTLTNPIDLSRYSNPKLSFWTKYDIEGNWDYGQVEISTNNGNAWIPLAGIYTKSGTGSFQPNGQPLYDGSRLSWVREEISLSGFSSDQVKLRFKLITDGAVERDGWYLDDIGILVYTAVPVELISFAGKVEQSEVMLTWETATEINNYGFEIERSQMLNVKSQNWEKIGFVGGNGTTTETKSYSFVDNVNEKFGKYSYRLKQIDHDGSFKYSNEIEVLIQPGKFSLEQNYPNPFNPSTKISWQSPVRSWQTLKVYDVLGNEVATLLNEEKEAGSYEVEFQSAARLPDGQVGNRQLASGVYIYRLQVYPANSEVGSFTDTKKMILLR